MLNYFFVSSFSHVNLSKAVCYSGIWVAHSVKPQLFNTVDSGFESRWLQKVLWWKVARTMLLFQMSDLLCAFVLNQKPVFVPFHLNFCSVLNFWTYMFILCTLCFCHFALPALRRPSRSSRARPRHCCLQLYLLLLLLLLLLLYSSNGSLWQPYEGNMGKWWNLAHL